MDKTEFRAMIKYLVLEGQSAKQVEKRLTVVYDDASPPSTTVKRWAKEFQCGRDICPMVSLAMNQYKPGMH